MLKTQRSREEELRDLNRTAAAAARNFLPPEKITVTTWADRYRRLPPDTSAEPGAWRTARTPYLREIMDAFTDPRLHHLVLAASSQVGKTEAELNMLAYLIDNDPGPALFVMPTLEVAEDFSKRRLAPLIRDHERLRTKVADLKSRDSNNTVLRKSFPGGMLTLTGSNSPSALASIPARYVFGDERDRWALSAGTEGDPWLLAEARTKTFYNAKLVEVSTPTVKGRSAIEASFALGTRERWCHPCPACGEFHQIRFQDIRFEHSAEKLQGQRHYLVRSVHWACPSCGVLHMEEAMRGQPARWLAGNPAAYENGIRSFWLNGFSSPWLSWPQIVLQFLQAQHEPAKLQVVYNTVFGELWEDRGELEDEEGMLARREEYGAELPPGLLVLTCGVDTQDDRLEYEVVGWGRFGESWGVKRGVILGRPDTPEVWQRFDDLIGHSFRYADGRSLLISLTCVDSGGHYTQEVYRACRERQDRRVFAIKGKGGEGVPLTQPPKQTKIVLQGRYLGQCWLYSIGVDAGKASIMSSLKVQETGPKYCHFPLEAEFGYDAAFFRGLLSEKLVLKQVSGCQRWAWEKLHGHNRNEALDCRNYALAALRILDPDLDALEQRLKEKPLRQLAPQPKQPKKQRYLPRCFDLFDEW